MGKTYYEVMLDEHYVVCSATEKMIAEGYMDKPGILRQIAQEAIDRAFVLGEIIDNMSVKLAERTV